MIESAVERITFFEDRAEVVRRARVEAAAGATWVAIAGIGVAVDDASLVARAQPGRVLGARVVRRVRQVAAADAAEIDAREAEVRAARGRRAAAGRTLERAMAVERRSAQLLEAWQEGVARVPKDAASWRAAHDAALRALVVALDQVAAARVELEHAQRDEARAALRLAQARATQPRYEATAEVQIEAAGGPVEIELSYRTACALWRPEHVARLVALDGGRHELELATVATVWQQTGEDWRAVPAVRFSTARPAQAASPPLLGEDKLHLARKADKTVHVEARDLNIALAGLGRGGRTVDDMPGLEDGGEPRSFAATRPVTIASDGQPFRVEVGAVRLPCTVELVAMPELAAAAHVRATATLAWDRPLLAGPVRLARGPSLVGRGRVGFVGQGEPFELGFGADDAVRVRRRVDDKRETGLTGTQKLTRTVRLYLSNLGAASKSLTVIERFPVSELDEVQIKVTDAGGATLDETDGFARFAVELGGNSTRELELVYRIEAKAQVQLSL